MPRSSVSFIKLIAICTLLILWRQSAVVRGAALRGLEGIAPRMKRGLSCAFRQGTDPEELAYIDDFDNSKLCSGRIEWMIAKASYA